MKDSPSPYDRRRSALALWDKGVKAELGERRLDQIVGDLLKGRRNRPPRLNPKANLHDVI